MKKIIGFIKSPYSKIILALIICIGFLMSVKDEPSDTIDTRFSVDSEYLGTYFPIIPLSEDVCKHYVLTITRDQVEETITDSTGMVTQRLKSDFVKIYEIYNSYNGQRCKVFCLDRRGRIIQFIFDKYCNTNQTKIITKSFATARKPGKKIEELKYQELYSVHFTNDTAIYDKPKFDGGPTVSKKSDGIVSVTDEHK